MPTGIAVKLAGALALLAMLIGAILITKFYFIDEWAEPEALDKRAKSNCTLVTAFFILGGTPSNPPSRSFQRALSRHHSYLRLILLLRLPIVIFTDTYNAEFVADVRRSIAMENCTKIWNMSLDELPLQANASLFRSIIAEEHAQNGWHKEWDPELRDRPESRSVDYHILANSKSYFLQNASLDNPFNRTTFVWLDPTYGHGQPSFFPVNFEWSPKIPAGKMTLLKQISPANESVHSYGKEDLYHRDLSLISTEFMAGDQQAIGQFHSAFQQKLLFEAASEQTFDDDDQTIMVMLIKENPQLFNMAKGQWFNAFHLF